MQKNDEKTALGGFRVLDLSDQRGYLCGRVLADLGADVIKIEPPRGDPGRSAGPFYHDIPDDEKSLYWLFYNANKRGITLNLEAVGGRDIFKRMVEKADCVVESFRPGHMESLGLDYGAISRINPAVVMTSITAFGQTGPYANYDGPDIVTCALGGMLFTIGSPDRPPTRISFPQAFIQTATEAAVGTLIALYHRMQTGKGQYVDVSAQQTITWFLSNAIPFWFLDKLVVRRSGSMRTGVMTSTVLQQLWPCKDGFVAFMLMGGVIGVKSNKALSAWMREEQVVGEHVGSMDWETFDPTVAGSSAVDRIQSDIARFFLAHTKDQLYTGAIKRGVTLYPLSNFAEILENPQLRYRGYWRNQAHLELGTALKFPGPFIKASETPLGASRPAPLIGEHNEEVYCGEMAMSKQELVMLKQAGVI